MLVRLLPWLMAAALGSDRTSGDMWSPRSVPAGGIQSPTLAAALDRSRRLHNISQTIEELLDGYDIRLRPQFGGIVMGSRGGVNKVYIDLHVRHLHPCALYHVWTSSYAPIINNKYIVSCINYVGTSSHVTSHTSNLSS